MHEIVAAFQTPFETFAGQVVLFLPKIVGALVTLLVGLLVARGLRFGVHKVLRVARMDEMSEKVQLHEILARVGLGKSLTDVVALMVFWFFILVTLAGAASILKLDTLTMLFAQFVDYLPKVLASVVILFGGFVVAHSLGEMVQNAATANKIGGAQAIARVTKVVVVVYASIMALGQLGLETELLKSSINIALGTVGLALAIAFGLGGRDVAAEMIRDHVRSKKQSVPPRPMIAAAPEPARSSVRP
jgi:hypothetical protein